MLKFLRHRGLHMLYFSREGLLPQLDPTVYIFGHASNGKKTIHMHEPLWFYKLRLKFFCNVGSHRCESRTGDDGTKPDRWQYGSDGNRVCSFCGSMHPEDFLRICSLTLTDERYAIETTSKKYKVYVKQPGILNASQGAIKFYMWHASAAPTSEEQSLFSSAANISNKRLRDKYYPKEAAE